MEKMYSEGILSTVGNTPLIKLNKIFKDISFNLFAKLECFNPAGSIKDRAALCIIENALKSGKIKQGTTVIESSSGNMAIGMALACAYYKLNFICVVDPKISSQNLKILEIYGAKIEMVECQDITTGSFLQARLNRVKALLKKIKNSYWPCQYTNEHNPMAHYKTTMSELMNSLRKIDFLFCAVSTCGTLKGCIDYIKDNKMNTKIVAVDALGSVIFGGEKYKRLIPGHGAAIEPFFSKKGLKKMVDTCIRVSDLDCVVGCHRLLKEEALLVGGSSGGVIMAVEKMKDLITCDSNCVLIFPDRGERYIDTIYSKDWVKKHFDNVSIL
ncbi:MAG: 2,3-diaminopropionate biosynthesis protein SbnA [Bacteroidetes bacterium]|nr:2,3-diaminopropionate biosynthesis protein SbnA [Bacteroidota bacterium]